LRRNRREKPQPKQRGDLGGDRVRPVCIAIV
jgi:hypothetical protein